MYFIEVKMKAILETYPNDLIKNTAESLKKIEQVKPPKWSTYVKTGVHKERQPVDPDWWYIRSAAVLRSVHKLGPIGVSKLRTKYGGRKNRGVAADKVYKGSGKILRLVLQQLEEAGFVKQGQKGTHKGRIITPKGISLLSENSSSVVVATKPKKEEKAPKKKAEKKEEPKAEEPKVEEPKVEEPKVEEPKVEEPKVEEPKVEEPKVEEPKVEEPKVEEPKVEEPKVEEPKVEEPKVEEPKVEEPKVEEPEAEKKSADEKVE
jgi:small subunit ribosomal protein S19e